MNVSHYGFVGHVSFSNKKINKSQEKEIIRKKMRNKNSSGIRELFANNSHLTNIISISICNFWN